MASYADSPSGATKDTIVSTKAPPVDEDDLDPAAFLKSVRELSAKREREDNERFRKLEQEIEKGRQERLARRAEYARSISPEKRDSVSRPSQTQSPAPPRKTSADVSVRAFTPISTKTTSETPSSSSPAGVEEVPEFTGFGSSKKAMSTIQTPTSSPTPAPKPSPSAAMPSRSGTLKWQQRPQSRAGTTRPLSMVAAENSAQAKSPPPDVEPSRDQIAASLGSRDPSWFRQTADRGVGNAAFRKSTDTDIQDVVATSRKGLPGMTKDITNGAALRASSISTTASVASYDRSTVPESQTADTSVVESEASTTASQSAMPMHAPASTLQGRFTRAIDRSPSPTKEMGGFVQSAMMKRSNSINKRSVGQYSAGLDRASSIRSGFGGLQGSHSMPKLDRPTSDAPDATDSLVRPLSSMNLTQTTTTPLLNSHARTKSITSAYTTNDEHNAASLPSSPSKRWSPNKSSWIEKALIAKPDSRPASPTKNSQPAWMSNLAKANAQRASAEEAQQVSAGGKTQPESGERSIQPASAQSMRQVASTETIIQLPSAEDRVQQSSLVLDNATASTQAAELPSPPIDQALAATKTVVQPGKSTSPTSDLQTPARLTASPKPDTSVRSKPVVKSPKPEGISGRQVSTSSSTTQQDIQSPPLTSPRTKPQPSPKPQIDFRSTLKPRAATEPKPREEPEFLSRFGTLRKATTEKYVAPDLLKNNILRGKAGLASTDGPQKSEIKDDFKDSLLAKKEQWRQERQDGIRHEHKSAVPVTPSKPEALAKRDVLGRAGTVKAPISMEKDKPTTPEALRRHQSIRQKPVQPASTDVLTTSETSKLAARFNPGLANILARGPPTTSNNTDTRQSPDKSDSLSRTDESRGSAEQLHDVRKGRAKGPKRRKAGVTTTTTMTGASSQQNAPVTIGSPIQAGVSPASGVTATTIMASTKSSPLLPPKPTISPKPSATQTPPLGWDAQIKSATREVPDFKGFSKTVVVDIPRDDDKENDSGLRGSKPSPIQVLSKKDEEAAMRSAKLLASHSSSTENSPVFSGLGISGPPRPIKSSRIVSGQLQEASLNKVLLPKLRTSRVSSSSSRDDNAAQRIDARALFFAAEDSPHESRTIRTVVYRLDISGLLEKVQARDEYTFNEESVYLLKHTHMRRGEAITTDIYIWIGKRTSVHQVNTMHAASRGMAGASSTRTQTIRQGYETRHFLRAIGGIMITRVRSTYATEPYMLCGRKHLGHIVFDEVDCRPRALCSAFVYLIWSPTATAKGTVYLWKGSVCSTEEISAAKLATMDLTEHGDITEVDEGMESSGFWEVFSAWPFREDVPPCPQALRGKAEAMNDFAARLYEVQRRQTRPGFFSSLLRRPSWGSRPSTPVEEFTYEAKEISPFTQADLNAESIYLMDSYSRLDVLIGPLHAAGDDTWLHTLHLAQDYAELCANERTIRPEVHVVLHGLPPHIPHLFRYWDEQLGLWSTAGLMAGSTMQSKELRCISLQEALASRYITNHPDTQPGAS
ncbi:hypothetical protein AMS68_001757 [Peltaster fructicola]|uniref:Uncharacterized protein n=1 Tax=Peltaster fructicola TaxID=286661 RepID=A0A6H0XP26_9PEZI|nr:hypothetical protein AMS68_001757 [Peltaster fructicola]